MQSAMQYSIRTWYLLIYLTRYSEVTFSFGSSCYHQLLPV